MSEHNDCAVSWPITLALIISPRTTKLFTFLLSAEALYCLLSAMYESLQGPAHTNVVTEAY